VFVTVEVHPPERNFVSCSYGHRTGRVPLADVVNVWQQSDGHWAIVLKGALTDSRSGSGSGDAYTPLV
jgi:hypothetical protein